MYYVITSSSPTLIIIPRALKGSYSFHLSEEAVDVVSRIRWIIHSVSVHLLSNKVNHPPPQSKDLLMRSRHSPHEPRKHVIQLKEENDCTETFHDCIYRTLELLFLLFDFIVCMHTTSLKLLNRFLCFLKKALQACIYLIQSTAKTVQFWNISYFIITVFYLNKC